jgi:nucleotide-binding universal stress UspA family protein
MITQILLAVDGSPASRRAAAAVRELAAQGISVRVLHVEEQMVTRDGLVSSHVEPIGKEVVDDIVKEFEGAGIDCSLEIREDLYPHVARAIVQAARDYGAQLIAMGSRGRTNIGAVLVGSTSHKVLHLSDIPVLLVP